jgi:hypothetical protein
MKNKTPFMWRKGIVLSATFLICLSFVFSCKKKESPIGQNNIDQEQLLLSAGVDTFSLKTYNYFDDTVITDNAAFGLLGSYMDPVFGKYNAEIYTQFRLQGFNPDFGNINTIVVDSFVLALEYIGYYGKKGYQNFEVYELGESLHIDSTYYSFTTKAHLNNANLVAPGKGTKYLDPDKITVIDNDTIDTQLRLQLSTSRAKNMLLDAMSGGTNFASNDNFLTYFKGLHIKTNNLQSSGEGGVFYFNLNDPASKLTIYYRQGGEKQTFNFLINSNCSDFNHVDIDNSMTRVETVNNDTISGQTQFYSQAFGSRAVIEIPGLSNIPSTAVIHKAVLELPVAYQDGNVYSPGYDISVATRLNDGTTNLYSVNVNGVFDTYRKSFKIDLRAYVQSIVTKSVPNTGLIVAPLLYNTTSDRIIFNGPNTSNKNKPKISILYTEF